MIRILCCTVFLSFTLAHGQVVITADDMPQVGETYLAVQAFETDFADPALTAGEDVEWNFGAITAVNDQFTTFLSVSEVPFAFQFIFNNPAHESYANRAVSVADFGVGVEVPVTDGHQFYLVNDSGFYDCGVAGNLEGFPVFGNRQPTDRIFRLPLEFGMEHDSSYSFLSIEIPGMGYGNSQLYRQNTVDAWGTVITPDGTFDALRVRSVVNQIDTIVAESFGINQVIVHPETVEYRWMSPEMGIPVLQINFSEGVVTEVLYRSEDTDVSIPEAIPFEEVKVYPNPARDHVQVDLPTDEKMKSVSLIDLSGKAIQPGFAQNGNVLNVQLNDVNSGLYRLIMASENNRMGSWVLVQP